MPATTRRGWLNALGGLTGTAAVAWLTGCGAVGAPAAPAKVAGGKITFGTWGSGPDRELYGSMVDAYVAGHPGATVDYVPTDGDTSSWYEKLLTMLAGGTPPDVANMYYPWVAEFVTKAVVLDQTPLVKRDKYPVDDYFPGALNAFKYQNKLSALPYYAGPSMCYVNQTLLTREGITIPDEWDWTQFTDIARRVTKRQGVAQAQFMTRKVDTGLNFFNAIIWEFGGDIWDEQMTTAKINQPGAVAALQYVQDLYLKHQVIPAPQESAGQGDLFKAGRLALSVNDCRCSVPDLATIRDFELATAPLPRGPAGRITRDGPNALAVLSSSAHAETAWDFAKWWASEEGQAQFLMTRRSVPTRKSIADGALWKQALLPWEKLAHYTESMKDVRPMPYPVAWTDVKAAWSDQVANPVLKGEKAPKDALDAFKPVLDGLLARK